MKVWILIREVDYEEAAVEAVYGKEEEAEYAADELEKNRKFSFEHFRVEEYEVI